jgi:hypothetical protein
MRTVLAVVVCIMASFGSFSFTMMAIDRTPPITYEGARAIQPTVKRGGNLDVEFQVFRTRICPTVAKRWVIDAEGIKHAIPSYTVGMKLLAGRETYQRSITVPENAAIGRAWYEVTLNYYCNFLHKVGWPIVVNSPPIEFTVSE